MPTLGSFHEESDCAIAAIRSFIPSLCDNSLDILGFSLIPGDFHSQNAMATDVESPPHIAVIVNGEFSSMTATTSYEWPPLFIIDHALRLKNIQDQAVLYKLL